MLWSVLLCAMALSKLTKWNDWRSLPERSRFSKELEFSTKVAKLVSGKFIFIWTRARERRYVSVFARVLCRSCMTLVLVAQSTSRNSIKMWGGGFVMIGVMAARDWSQNTFLLYTNSYSLFCWTIAASSLASWVPFTWLLSKNIYRTRGYPVWRMASASPLI